MKWKVIVKADMNDADYITNIETYDDESLGGYRPLIEKVVAAIKAQDEMVKWGHNWPASEYANGSPEDLYEGVLTGEEINIFSDNFVPYGEYGIHTIESITILAVASEEELL